MEQNLLQYLVLHVLDVLFFFFSFQILKHYPSIIALTKILTIKYWAQHQFLDPEVQPSWEPNYGALRSQSEGQVCQKVAWQHCPASLFPPDA